MHAWLLRAVVVWAACLSLAGCESLPASGQTIRVEVVAVPLARAQLPRRNAQLLPALDAGIPAEAVAAGRLVLATCSSGEDASRRTLRSVVTLLPPGMAAPVSGALLEVARDAGELTRLGTVESWHHLGRYLGSGAAALDERNGVRHVYPDGSSRLDAHCDRPTRSGATSARVFRIVSPVEYREAAAMRARHALAGDEELAAGRIAEVRCELQVIDGSNWRTPHWLVRLPPGTAVAKGEVIEVRAGASEDSDAAGPLSRYLRKLDGPAARQRITCG